ncbi:putative beta-galactosidase 2 [Gracilariopsis chorda]|uniref:Beta-galactosidase n=1 Tax=Gracilariopsis chorda TaxID=448386 RepID=A0A2V3IVY0_9FLOR|nr:putative beta-galactosidase 2 [Gracilariopsis chorda]|eukprot:PXF45867.1 putative beta-galactosidase 2 [Gracilariopsis chorda]
MSHSPLSYDRRSFRLRGVPFLILSGSVHYIRLHPRNWPTVFRSFHQAHLNTLETYVFWGHHQHSLHPHYDFDASRDLFAYIHAAARAGLHVILRLGPYVCAEVSYGGFPFHLRHVPHIRFRTYNKPFMLHVQKWVRFLADQLHHRKLLASAGGPVILVQLENEYQMISDTYNAPGARYLQWMADLQSELDLRVPAIMCYGAANGVVETINAFYAHHHIDKHRAQHPHQPPVWTECWTGWYDVWGAPHHRRPLADLLYAVARFFAAGGAAINYYMWMGGTNFASTPMYLQATSYDYDAPIDEFAFQTTKSRHLALLHSVLTHLFEAHFHAHRHADPVMHNGVVQWGRAIFVCNDSKHPKTSFALPSGNRYTRHVKANTVHILDADTQHLLFDTSAILPHLVVTREYLHVNTASSKWTLLPEPVPTWHSLHNTDTRNVVSSELPREQLTLTADQSDYAFYVARFQRNSTPMHSITLLFEAADFARVYIDGCQVATSLLPLWEDRWRNKWADYPDGERANTHHLTVDDTYSQTIELCIMTNALGLVKGDWQLGNRNMVEEQKGLLSDVTINGWRRTSEWCSVGSLVGEQSHYMRQTHTFRAEQLQLQLFNDLPMWCSCQLQVSNPSDSWVLDLTPFGKGVLWVNGHLIGRFWDIKGTRGIHGFLKGSPIVQDQMGTYTQRYYHIPNWVVPEDVSEQLVLQVTMFIEAAPPSIPTLELLEAKAVCSGPDAQEG